ncbi:uncharacterized protein DSM5745_07533 [Aspergillus mulundensis]|uniref:Uncharacterized protein n=1 Tax=Aspergillus mulundensis TaxID=1810919 RepID=A0A3D8RER0_9EURO|nr:hypothetical protein DSM5745_07533 [Aspergillus mulundensis]RDW72361.1 hypothetical protein DSM5745_07533 [Aspergillus mulundensis]
MQQEDSRALHVANRKISVINKTQAEYSAEPDLDTFGLRGPSETVELDEQCLETFFKWLEEKCHYDGERQWVYFRSGYGDKVVPRTWETWRTCILREAPVFFIEAHETLEKSFETMALGKDTSEHLCGKP